MCFSQSFLIAIFNSTVASAFAAGVTAVPPQPITVKARTVIRLVKRAFMTMTSR